ncbi:hypothetical protein SDC9_179744 [bioreactor metagenome]|uniref:Uncharacterized protein n=1 Tax=bioreactor metagenome TaxID=1076179 RepID=A0A645H1A5_9ZZZZ
MLLIALDDVQNIVGGGGAYAQLALVDMARLAQRRFDLGRLQQQLLYPRQQAQARIGDGQPAALAREQLDLILLLQGLDLRRHRGLAQPQLACCLGDAAEAGDPEKGFELCGKHEQVFKKAVPGFQHERCSR